MNIEKRFLPSERARVSVEDREVDGESTPVIEGHASVFFDDTPETEFNLWDGAVERIMPGTFDRAIKEGDDARGLFNHDPNMVLGRVSADTVTLSVDKRGLKYSIDPPDTSAARDVVTLIRRGDVTGSSFAFMVTDQDWRTENEVDIREIRGVRLFDVSPVTFPAYEGADTGLRSCGGDDEARTSWDAWNARKASDAKGAASTAAAVRGYEARARELESGGK